MLTSTKITRKDLYAQVWAVPITRLAQQYGLSDVGLAKICKRNNIPRPGRGYWAQRQSGKHIKKTPLPKRNDDWDIYITPSLVDEYKPQEKKRPSIDQSVKESLKNISVPDALTDPHPLVGKSFKILMSCKTDSSDILIPLQGQCLDIRVSRESLSRALRIMDSLIKALIAVGMKISLSKESTNVEMQGVSCSITMGEILVRHRLRAKDHDLTGYYEFGYNRYERYSKPSGILFLEIFNIGFDYDRALRKKWKDTETKKLEECLGSVITGLFKVAAIKKTKMMVDEKEQPE